MEALDAALDAAWGGRTAASLAGGTLSEVISNQKPRSFSSQREAEAMKQMAPGTEVIKMGGGMPDHEFLGDNMPQLLSAAQNAWEAQNAQDKFSMLEYDFGSGVEAIKTEVADYLSRTRQQSATPDEVFITTGNMGGIQLACQAYLGPDTICVVESPLFSVSGRIAASTGAKIEPVGMDEEGIDVDALEATILAAEARGERVAMVYCQPLFHNPVGVSISLERATALLTVCAKHSVVVLSDEAYEAYVFEGPPPVYLSALSGGRGVISVHSFSKTVGTVGPADRSVPLMFPLPGLFPVDTLRRKLTRRARWSCRACPLRVLCVLALYVCPGTAIRLPALQPGAA
jgi:DNA-binding transcriptional MocR family regulator|eukprot:COSAG06_NODE_4095_length_4581_cov_5.947345_4_plen_344_part_00